MCVVDFILKMKIALWGCGWSDSVDKVNLGEYSRKSLAYPQRSLSIVYGHYQDANKDTVGNEAHRSTLAMKAGHMSL